MTLYDTLTVYNGACKSEGLQTARMEEACIKDWYKKCRYAILLGGGYKVSDFAYAYFNTELDKLDIPDLEGIFDKVQKLLAKKKGIGR